MVVWDIGTVNPNVPAYRHAVAQPIPPVPSTAGVVFAKDEFDRQFELSSLDAPLEDNLTMLRKQATLMEAAVRVGIRLAKQGVVHGYERDRSLCLDPEWKRICEDSQVE